MTEAALVAVLTACGLGAWRLQKRAASFEEEKKMLWALLIGLIAGAVAAGYVTLKMLKG